MFSVQQERQRGITLLEVLISIGILAIGLVSTLALLPAGGAYLKKAGTDNRAAALIHNAVNTMRASGLFKENAIYWGESSENKTDGENQVKGFPRSGMAGERNVTVPETYAISGTWSPRDIEPTLSGTVVRNDPDPAVDDDYVVISATRTGQRGGGGTIAPILVPLTEVDSSDTNFSDGKDYQWSYTVLPGALSGPSPTFQIYNSISDVNSAGDWRQFWYDEWDFDVTHNGSPVPNSDITVVPPPTPARPAAIDHPGGNPDSPSSYAHFLERPRHRIARGLATFDFMLGNSAGTNQTAEKATNLRFQRQNERGSRRDPNGRVYFHHSATFNVTGHLWRYQTGYRRGSYTESWNLSDINYLAALPPGNFNLNAGNGSSWLYSNGLPVTNRNRPLGVKQDGEDWLKTPVRFGETVILNFGETDDHILNNTLEADGLYKFPVYFDPNSDAFYGPLRPEQDGTSGEQYTYAIPDDGVLYVRTKMKDAPVFPAGATDAVSGDDIEYLIDSTHANHQNQSGLPHDPYLINTITSGTGFSTPGPGIPEYKFKLTIENATRVAAYDPLMAAHLDRIVGASGYNHALDEEQRFFAKFDQIDKYGNQRVLELPRLNWRGVATANLLDESVAIAERLCRPDDTLEVKLPADEDMPAEPIYENNGNENIRRRSVGKMSWMLTIQPETADSAPLESHWKSGNLIDVAVIVFENRQMPLLGDSAIVGEAEFEADWNELTGLFETYVPVSRGLDIDDLRAMFRANGWLMVAPKRYSHSQKIDWVQIQTCDIEEQLASADGLLPHRFTLSILPVNEPRAEACNNPPYPAASPQQRMLIHVQQGIVAVSRRTIQVESP